MNHIKAKIHAIEELNLYFLHSDSIRINRMFNLFNFNEYICYRKSEHILFQSLKFKP